MLLRAAGVWFGIMALAILNGTAREAWLTPRLGSQAGHVISTLILCAVILLVARLTIGWIGADRRTGAVLVGALWLVLTLAFEFLAGHYLFGAPWERILADYNLLQGRVWPLVPLTSFFAPVLVR